MAKLMHNVHFVNGLEYMPKEQKNAIILEMFSKMDDDSIDLAQVEEKM